MKNDGKTKLFVGAILGILLVISALIGLVLWPIHNELYPGMKTLYLVTKITVLVIFAIHIIFCLLPKAKFATKIVQTAFVLILQLVPLIVRIDFNPQQLRLSFCYLFYYSLFYFILVKDYQPKNLMKMKIELDIVLIIKDKKSSKVSCLL